MAIPVHAMEPKFRSTEVCLAYRHQAACEEVMRLSDYFLEVGIALRNAEPL